MAKDPVHQKDDPFSEFSVAQGKIADLVDTWHDYDLVIGTTISIGFQDKDGKLQHTVRHPPESEVKMHLLETPDAIQSIEGKQIWNVVGTTASHSASKNSSSLAGNFSGRKFWEFWEEDKCIACAASDPEIAHVCLTPREKWCLYMTDYRACNTMFVAPLCKRCNNKDREADPRTSKALVCSGKLYSIPLDWDKDKDMADAGKRLALAKKKEEDAEDRKAALEALQEEERTAKAAAIAAKDKSRGAAAKKKYWVRTFNVFRKKILEPLEAKVRTAKEAATSAKTEADDQAAAAEITTNKTAQNKLKTAQKKSDDAKEAVKKAKKALLDMQNALQKQRAAAETKMEPKKKKK